MRKLWLVSDLHADHSPWSPDYVPEHDVMIIAGDIADGADAASRELRRLRQYTSAPIIFVPGNHDHFGGAIDRFDDVVVDGVHVLASGQAVVIGGVRLVGATLWTDWLLNDREWQAQAWAARHMPEYGYVTRADGDLIWPIDVAAAHDRHRAAIEHVLRQPHPGPTVVVTHHAPTTMSLPKGERLHESAGAFASDLSDLIWRYQPELWVHGHVHAAADYMVGNTRVCCNPRGYQLADWSEKTGWDEGLVVEVRKRPPAIH